MVLSGNIKSGVKIFNVTGNLAEGYDLMNLTRNTATETYNALNNYQVYYYYTLTNPKIIVIHPTGPYSAASGCIMIEASTLKFIALGAQCYMKINDTNTYSGTLSLNTEYTFHTRGYSYSASSGEDRRFTITGAGCTKFQTYNATMSVAYLS